MEYEGLPGELLKKAGADIGDLIEIKGKQGILMPHHEFSGADIITVKLDSGYNIGIRVKKDTAIKLVEKGGNAEAAKKELAVNPNLPLVSVLGTGGTIASYVEYRTGAVHPAVSADDLVFSVPELADICNVRAKVLFSLLSENMRVEHWQKLAEEAAEELNEGARGVIIPHGTDTLGFTSAALSFMLGNLTGPVILVGSQRSSDRPSSDAPVNLVASARLATKGDLGEVVAVMHEEPSDSYAGIHRGTKVRKMHSSRRDAFRSINARPIGRIEGDKITLTGDCGRRGEGEVKANTRMEKDVSLQYFYPGLSPEHLAHISDRCRGAVIAGTGLGHTAGDMLPVIRQAIRGGMHIVMTTQCLYGTVNMNVYSTGRDLLKAGVIPGGDMLPETAYIKLMWVLGQTNDRNEVRKLMTANLRGELSERRLISGFGGGEE